ncbi:unnamed protein product [Medioppia subpectinata]|uniref:Uncharacterized protein n=1 Tax=Medioppia subpectinata TaxID=1979941 RepID=A0A7R9Q2Q5_9ACAR|nr:unnamed protein product [Medioppia subpectinata]CAG2110629.1 unnamed protein product [Medioppia subpectinata]
MIKNEHGDLNICTCQRQAHVHGMQDLPPVDFPHVFNEQIHVKDLEMYANSLGDEAQGYLLPVIDHDKKQGLTVVAQFYQDFIDALKPIVPTVFKGLENIQNPVEQHTVTTVVIGQLYDFTYMMQHVSELRAVKSLSVTGNEHNLMNRLKALESRVLAAVEKSKVTGLRMLRNHPVLNAWYDQLIALLTPEFNKINQAIRNLPSAALRQQNLQQLIQDLTHLTQMPFIL